MARDKKSEEKGRETKGEKKPKKTGKRVKSERKHRSKKWRLYNISGENVKKSNKSCPKCGPGVFLAQHKNRVSCGSCGYTESIVTKERKQIVKDDTFVSKEYILSGSYKNMEK